MSEASKRDHGGDLDAAIALFGGERRDWADLSTGINPVPYPVPELPLNCWTALPDQGALRDLLCAARAFWGVPEDAGILAVSGASAAIAHIPLLSAPGRVVIPAPTYNEHAASFAAAGWQMQSEGAGPQASVHVHPNNPDGRVWDTDQITGTLRVIDESFCDVIPEASMIAEATAPGTLILKSFGKFWGLAGVRLGFVIGDSALLDRLASLLGPWAVAGPALHIGKAALEDTEWAENTRRRLSRDAALLDAMMLEHRATLVGGTTLFRLYDVDDAAKWQVRLAQHHIWSRVFPYNPRWLRLGLPDAQGWDKLRTVFT
ncbi:MAG: threonine-phosphate decarboxylase [Sulfitobacter sp.]